MKFPECDQFRAGSHRWKICRNEAGLPPHKTDAYRAQWGLQPLFPDQHREAALAPYAIPELVFHGHSVSDPKEIRNKLYGPGSELLNIYHAAGVPTCEACNELARQMNNWGVLECRKRLEEIVADILPRAKAWLDAKHPWITRLIPDAIEGAGIAFKLRSDVIRAIDTAEAVMRDRQARKVNLFTGEKVSGCNSCGKPRTTTQPLVIREPITELKPRPFTAQPRLTLLCHCWPYKDTWRKHVEYLAPVSNVFHRKIMGVATGPGTATLDEVKAAFGDSWEYFEVPNDKKLREVATYRQMLPMAESTDENDVTFCIHTKGAQDHTAEASQIRWWIQAMYSTVVCNWRNVLAEMEAGASIAGSFMREGSHFRTRYSWHYSGTFFAFRNAATFSNGVPEIQGKWWGTEAWPGQHFHRNEAVCMFGHDAGNLYQPNEDLERQFVEWRAQNAM